jgi:hypothetical protein
LGDSGKDYEMGVQRPKDGLSTVQYGGSIPSTPAIVGT